MDYFPLNWGNPKSTPNSDEFNWLVTPNQHSHHASNPYQELLASSKMPIQHTRSPIVTGTSVVAVKYKDGIMMATDCLASYGSLARFRDVQRMTPVGSTTVVGVSGEISDYQYLQHVLNQLMVEEHENPDGHLLGPENIHAYLHRLLYHRRSKMNFLLNTVLVGGLQEGKPYLAAVDFRGVTYSASTMATGFGAHLAQPILRKAVEGKETILEEQEASELLDHVMRVLFYRDARSLNKIQKCIVNSSGVHLSKPYSLETEWKFAENIRGYGGNKGA